MECNLLENILALFAEFEWNNMLHNQVEKIINTILDIPNNMLQTYVMILSPSNTAFIIRLFD